MLPLERGPRQQLVAAQRSCYSVRLSHRYLKWSILEYQLDADDRGRNVPYSIHMTLEAIVMMDVYMLYVWFVFDPRASMVVVVMLVSRVWRHSPARRSPVSCHAIRGGCTVMDVLTDDICHKVIPTVNDPDMICKRAMRRRTVDGQR